MTIHCSLYLPCADKVVETLQSAVTSLGYQFYDPFGLIPGKAYSQAVRLFVAPAHGGWTRILGESPDPVLPPFLSKLAPCLWVELDGTEANIRAFADGVSVSPEIAFPAEADCIRLALNQTSSATSASLGGVTLDALPDDVQALSRQIDMQKAGALFNRMSGNLAKKSGAEASAADLLKQPDWNSTGGVRVSGLLKCLRILDWRQPDFVTLRDAYALHLRRQRSPNARLYPGDAETLAAVPDALAYTPIYAGRS